MRASPERPGQVVGKGARRFADKTKEKPPNFGNAEGNHYREIRRHMGLNKIGCFKLRRLERLLRLFFVHFLLR